MAAQFDPTHALRFEFDRGTVTRVGGASRLLAPVDSLVALLRGATEDAARNFAESLGTEAGRLAASRLSESSTVEEVVDHLGGELALLGVGALSIERWGRALVLRLDSCPVTAAGDALLIGLAAGALRRLFARDTQVVVLSREEDTVRLLVAGEAAAGRVRWWLGEGASWGEILSRLNAGTGRGDA